MDKRLKVFVALLVAGLLVIIGVWVKPISMGKSCQKLTPLQLKSMKRGKFSANVHARNPLKATDVVGFPMIKSLHMHLYMQWTSYLWFRMKRAYTPLI